MINAGGHRYITKEKETEDWKAELEGEHSTVRILREF
jgi:hypothetical protein